MASSAEITLEEERVLVERAVAGDGEAFGKIYDAFKSALYRTVVFPRLRDEKAAEEVLQETFLLAIEKIGSFEWQDRSIFFWLRMIAINKCREYIASSRRHATVDESVLDYQHDTSYQPESEVVVEDYRQVLRERIDDVFGLVRERYARALSLRLKDKKSREECADLMEVSIETFDVLFFRACKAFKKAYIEKYGKI